MKTGHIAQKTPAQLDRLEAFIRSEMPFPPSQDKMAAHMSVSQSQIRRYIAHLERKGRVIVHPETGMVAIEPEAGRKSK